MFQRGWKKTIGFGVLALAVVFVLIQLVPVHKTNPPLVSEPTWDSPQTRALVKDACFDCHSNETTWPWYSKIAPSSWLLVHDVDEGRSTLNFSEWGQGEAEVDEIVEVIDEGEMPPWYYALMHPKAKLSDSEKQALINGLSATTGQSAGQVGDESGESKDDD
jgi:cytochrome c551/c552